MNQANPSPLLRVKSLVVGVSQSWCVETTLGLAPHDPSSRGAEAMPLSPTAARALLQSYLEPNQFSNQREGGDYLLLCHAPSQAMRLGLKWAQPHKANLLDIMELFGFARPAQFTLPTVKGLARACHLHLPQDGAEAALLLPTIALTLFADVKAEVMGGGQSHQLYITELLQTMQAGDQSGGWPWAMPLLHHLGEGNENGLESYPSPPNSPNTNPRKRKWSLGEGLDVWKLLEEWPEEAPPPPASNNPVSGEETRRALLSLLGTDRQMRQGQLHLAETLAYAFQDKGGEGPNLIMAEAGTGIGKTLGYLAPAHFWAKRNQASVWISTYTRNLQQQIADEVERIYPHKAMRDKAVVIRKGRENYLCLLNYEDEVKQLGMFAENVVLLGLISRWIANTASGDLNGSDFPSWALELFPPSRIMRLADRRGECIYSACRHYRKCFGEKVQRTARQAELVIANHALTMRQMIYGEEDRASLRLVFDEGHHLFEAADSAFAIDLTAGESADLRRYIRGAESGRRGRGLEEKLSEYLPDNQAGESAKQALLLLRQAASALPHYEWESRLFHPKGIANGPLERFFQTIYHVVRMRASDGELEGGFDLECQVSHLDEKLRLDSLAATKALDQIYDPAKDLDKALRKLLASDPETLEGPARLTIEKHQRRLEQRVIQPLLHWRSLLETVLAGEIDQDFIDRLIIIRAQGQPIDCGLTRHWLDPTRPLAEQVLTPAHGVVITSATLTAGEGETPGEPSRQAWQQAESLSGATYMARPPLRFRAASPFAYDQTTRVFIANDVRLAEIDEQAAALLGLFKASGGGGLGLFNSIRRLKQIHQRLAAPMEALNLPLYGQHVDGIGTTNLIDLFRAEDDACLLGTDAVRDGIDVPGRSLRLLVYERVPWPRPDLLHKARRSYFAKQWGLTPTAYDDMITRKRLRQAYGRLIRREQDHGIFVMLDNRCPSRLLDAFPAGVICERLPLQQIISQTRILLDHWAETMPY